MPVVWQETSTFCKITQGLSNQKTHPVLIIHTNTLYLHALVFSSKKLRVYNQQVLVSFQREGQRCWEDKARLNESAWDGKLLESNFSSPSLGKMGFKRRTFPQPRCLHPVRSKEKDYFAMGSEMFRFGRRLGGWKQLSLLLICVFVDCQPSYMAAYCLETGHHSAP